MAINERIQMFSVIATQGWCEKYIKERAPFYKDAPGIKGYLFFEKPEALLSGFALHIQGITARTQIRHGYRDLVCAFCKLHASLP